MNRKLMAVVTFGVAALVGMSLIAATSAQARPALEITDAAVHAKVDARLHEVLHGMVVQQQMKSASAAIAR